MTDKRLHFSNGNEEIYVLLSEIIFIECIGNYCIIRTDNSRPNPKIRITITKIMQIIEECGTYAAHHLLKVDRSLIVNTSLIIHIAPNEYDKDTKTIENKIYFDKVNQHKKNISHKITTKGLKVLQDTMGKEKRNLLLKIYGRNYMLSVPMSDMNAAHPKHNGHEFVDLGLPSGTLWATCNIFSKRIEIDGTTLQRNEPLTKESFEICEYDILTQKEIDAYTVTDDIANNYWRGDWQMPTEADFQELKDECNWVWCRTDNKRYGALITGNNGNTLFLPADNQMKIQGYYWTSEKHRDLATSAHIEENRDSGGVKVSFGTYPRVEEAFVRPVLHKSNKE